MNVLILASIIYLSFRLALRAVPPVDPVDEFTVYRDTLRDACEKTR